MQFCFVSVHRLVLTFIHFVSIGGAVQEIAFHPNDPNKAFSAAVNRGLMRTSSYKASMPEWFPVNLGAFSAGVSSVDWDKSNSSVIVVGSGCVSSDMTCPVTTGVTRFYTLLFERNCLFNMTFQMQWAGLATVARLGQV